MDCEQTRRMLPRYAAGDLPEAVWRGVQAHLDCCYACNEEKAELEWLLAVSGRALERAASIGDWADLERRMQIQPNRQACPRRGRRRRAGQALGRLGVAATVMFMLGGLFGFMMLVTSVPISAAGIDAVPIIGQKGTPDELLGNNIVWRKGIAFAAAEQDSGPGAP
ncbi:MAG TPA: zf-HC2 domain-containing protein [Candidatus Hydrogenedentes bacterium]|nr:zf-HC2 domain-containing protein [Candidatus Hydrogenedentota bacterium]HIJ74255.1 zf-HC2 domain-containing protein [Candidatus Hydrogenedentota bacterium]